MPKIDDTTRIHHMVDASRRARELVVGKPRQQLDSNDVLGLALVRLLEILGEAANGVSPELRERHPDVPWRQIISRGDPSILSN